MRYWEGHGQSGRKNGDNLIYSVHLTCDCTTAIYTKKDVLGTVIMSLHSTDLKLVKPVTTAHSEQKLSTQSET